MNRGEVISKSYDYIVNSVKKQNRLLPCNVLYGDGSRWSNDKEAFYQTYNQLKEMLNQYKLIDENGNCIEV